MSTRLVLPRRNSFNSNLINGPSLTSSVCLLRSRCIFFLKQYFALNVNIYSRLTGIVLLSMFLPIAIQAQDAATNSIAGPTKQKEDAIAQVNHIVNQPVTAFRRTESMEVSEFGPGWFHPGANTPDFDRVDVRQSQETALYSAHKYVASDLNPNMVFLGDELEFNANTKLFYTNRALPKKKLSEADMLEINRLYRIIGQCNRQIAALQNPGTAAHRSAGQAAETDTDTTPAPGISRDKMILIFSGAVVLVVIVFIISNLLRKKS